MRIGLLCATRRGYLFLKKLIELLPPNNLIVFSFREEPWEPLFFDDIRELTLAAGGKFFEARHVGSHHWNLFWETTAIDIMFVVSWRYMIPASVYNRPRLGTFVFHDSLLPEYRGFAPTVWAIINGEDHTGVTLFKIADEVDAGDIVDQQRVPIGTEDTIAVVIEHVTRNYLNLLERNLDKLLKGITSFTPQDHSRATYTCKLVPEDNRINWAASSESIYNLIRAVSAPYPGAYTYLSDQKLRIWSAQRVANPRRYIGRIPGRIIDVRSGEGSVILTGDGVLLLKEVQIGGGETVCAAKVLNSITQTLGG